MSVNRKWAVLLSTLIVISLVLSACGTPTPQVVVETKVVEKQVTKVVEVAAPKWTGPGFGGVLNVGTAEGMPSIDAPATTSSSTQEFSVNVHETLVALGENYMIVPMLAQSWDVSSDGKTYTFHLRQGIKFHNGQEMTSEDVIASYERLIAISPGAARFAMVDTYEAPDKYTVVYHLKAATRAFLGAVAALPAMFAIQPKSIIQGKKANELKVPDEIIGTGPYMLASYDPDRLTVLKRFPDYQPLPGARDGAGGAKIPYFDEIDIHIVPESGSKVAGFEAGDYDIILTVRPAEYGQLKGRPGLNVGTFYPGLMRLIQFNDWDPKFGGNVKFRQAIQAALNMTDIGMLASGGDPTLFSVTPSLWPPGTAMYMPDDPVIAGLYNQNNVAKAKQLLAEVGYKGEELIYLSYEQPPLIAQAVAKQLEDKLGLNIKIEVMDWPAVSDLRASHTGFNFNDNDWGSFNYQPLKIRDFLYSTSTSLDRGNYTNKDLDAACDAALYALTTAEEKAAWRTAQRVIFETVPFVKFYDEPSFYAASEKIEDYVGWYRPRYFGVWKK